MKSSNLTICNETIHPGEYLSLALPIPEYYSCAPLFMPIKVIHGKKPGPCLLITAGMYGNELNGSEIIHRLFNVSELSRISGTLIAVPVLNVHGLINRSKLLPGGVDLDRCFPGSKNGTHASRMAHRFTQEIFSIADYCIDLQTGPLNQSNLPHLFINTEDKESQALAEVFNAPVISKKLPEKGSLRSLAKKKKIPFLHYEAGEALRFDEHAIRIGQKGIMNVIRELGMLPKKGVAKNTTLKSLVSEKITSIWASTSGMSHSKIKLGQYVKKNEVLCTINDPFGSADPVNIKSPEEGIIVSRNNLPLVHEGENLFQMAVFPKMQHAADHLSNWKETSTKKLADG